MLLRGVTLAMALCVSLASGCCGRDGDCGDGRDDHHGRRWGARGQWDDEACDDDDDDAGDAGGAGPTADAGGGGARDAGGVGGGGASDAGGGGASDAGGGGASGCASDADCAAGSICLAGACRATCPSGTDVECMRVDVAFSRCNAQHLCVNASGQ